MSTKQLVSVRVDGEVWRRARVLALAAGRPVSAIVEELVAGWVASAGPAGERFTVVERATGKTLAREVSRSQAQAVIDARPEPICRRCGHREGAHRGMQRACGQMGCSCARFRAGDE